MSIIIEPGCNIHESAIIGTEPFALNTNWLTNKKTRKEAKGGLIIKSGADIGPAVTIQKGVTRPTVIGPDSFLNGGVRVGHDVQIGYMVRMGFNSTVSGYTVIGDYTVIGPGVTISNRLTIGPKARIRIGSLVVDDVPPGGDYCGRPAIDFDEFKRLRKRMKELLRDE